MTRQRGVPPWLRDIVCLAVGVVGFGYCLRVGADPMALLVSAALMAEPALLRALAGIAGSGSSSSLGSSGRSGRSRSRRSAPPDDGA